jgi:hypothetical protein
MRESWHPPGYRRGGYRLQRTSIDSKWRDPYLLLDIVPASTLRGDPGFAYWFLWYTAERYTAAIGIRQLSHKLWVLKQKK